MLIQPHFVKNKTHPEKMIQWKKVDCEIQDSNGKTIFHLKNVEAPKQWSQLAIEIAASKYFKISANENSVRKLVNRVVSAITESGRAQGYFKSQSEAQTFAHELTYILLTQKAFFNSPVWFNCGVYSAFRIKGDSTHYAWDFKKKKVVEVIGAYQRPQVSACFIQSVEDNLESIFDLVKTEAKLFKYGSGSGTNFSNLRSRYEKLAHGGTSSGLISFLEVLDKGAGSVKSGGVTRRAAKMVCLDDWHPEVMDFISWKAKEEKKAHALIRQGYSADFEGEAYKTISGQNANNSVRLSDAFMKAIEQSKTWSLKSPVNGKVIKKIPAVEIWKNIISSAWFCADPGVQFKDNIQKWHTCPKDGTINASNPCSEYLFLDDSACNLASLNLLQFLSSDGKFLWEDFKQTCRVIFLAQDILVDYASYPTEKIAQNSHQFRPLGIGYAGLGALLMRMGYSYDSDEGRAWASGITAFLHGESCLQSIQISQKLGAFSGFKKNKIPFLKVMKKHQKSLAQISWHHLPQELEDQVKLIYDDILSFGKKYGFRNSQISVLAPTGTIGLVMDSDTTGIEPEFSLIKWKKMAGGGKVKIVSTSMPLILKRRGYSESEIKEIERQLLEGMSIEQISSLKKTDHKLFLCAQANSDSGLSLSAEAHLKMMAAVQPFLSGGISKTVNMPETATANDIEQVYLQAWKMGLKSVAIYRNGSKMSQPLNVNSAMICPECGGSTEISGGCYRCTNCGYSTGCVS